MTRRSGRTARFFRRHRGSPNTHLNMPFSMNFFHAAERMQRTLACGNTTAREAGGSDLGVKEGSRAGPGGCRCHQRVIKVCTSGGVLSPRDDPQHARFMADLGMSPTAVFESSTRIAAELMGVDGDLGTLEVGKLADAVMFSGTELDVGDLGPRVASVFQGGARVA